MNDRIICMITNKIRRVLGNQNLPRIFLMDDLPEEVEDNSIYITGVKGKWYFCSLKCPCGCGEIIELNLDTKSRPKWKVIWHKSGTISLSPSVNRTLGCISHFYYRFGTVVWCGKTTVNRSKAERKD